MKIGVLLVLFQNETLEKALDLVKGVGVEAVEIGTGGYAGNTYCNPAELLKNPDSIKKFQDTITSRELEISALSCHGNPVHPNSQIAASYHQDFENTVLLAKELGVKNVLTFSGCPGDSENGLYPNWVTCPWPKDFSEVLEWQWEKKLIAYWKKAGQFAQDHGVQVGIEMHPGFCVYNPETLLKLRNAVGDVIGANFDPSHLFWQGIDPIIALKKLEGAVFHIHAKDTKIDVLNSLTNGNLDTKPYTQERKRSWIFRTVGYGHDLSFWKDFVSTCRLIGYDEVLSIEHEDSLMSAIEGFRKAFALLKEALIREPIGTAWWV
ncbi:MAG: sugar phosphate isomerase/epimerase [Candidatus Atribacteria bacterium]|nr:sugar phosphate isomerase/epimerase [Candidatus Atribacteria bacterium]